MRGMHHLLDQICVNDRWIDSREEEEDGGGGAEVAIIYKFNVLHVQSL